MRQTKHDYFLAVRLITKQDINFHRNFFSRLHNHFSFASHSAAFSAEAVLQFPHFNHAQILQNLFRTTSHFVQKLRAVQKKSADVTRKSRKGDVVWLCRRQIFDGWRTLLIRISSDKNRRWIKPHVAHRKHVNLTKAVALNVTAAARDVAESQNTINVGVSTRWPGDPPPPLPKNLTKNHKGVCFASAPSLPSFRRRGWSRFCSAAVSRPVVPYSRNIARGL